MPLGMDEERRPEYRHLKGNLRRRRRKRRRRVPGSAGRVTAADRVARWEDRLNAFLDQNQNPTAEPEPAANPEESHDR